MLPWLLRVSQGLKVLTVVFSVLASRKCSTSNQSLYQTDQLYPIWSISHPNGFYLPDSMWDYSNKPIYPPLGNKGYPILLLLQSLPPTVPYGLLCSWERPLCGPACHVVTCFEYMWLVNFCPSHMSSLRCHAFDHPKNPRVVLPPIPLGWREVKKISPHLKMLNFITSAKTPPFFLPYKVEFTGSRD